MNNAVRQLNVFVDYDDLFRCGGRIDNVIVHNDTNFPYLIPKTHYFTNLVVTYIHAVVLHNGVTLTVLKVSKENEDVSNNKEPFVF